MTKKTDKTVTSSVEVTADAAVRDAEQPHPGAQPDTAPATDARPVVKVVAPAGPRRRAGLAFGPVVRELTEADLGETREERDERLKTLLADPMLSVSPVLPDQAD